MKQWSNGITVFILHALFSAGRANKTGGGAYWPNRRGLAHACLTVVPQRAYRAIRAPPPPRFPTGRVRTPPDWKQRNSARPSAFPRRETYHTDHKLVYLLSFTRNDEHESIGALPHLPRRSNCPVIFFFYFLLDIFLSRLSFPDVFLDFRAKQRRAGFFTLIFYATWQRLLFWRARFKRGARYEGSRHDE